MSKAKILPYNYLSGVDFTDNLKHLANCKTFLELAEILDVPKATFSTWNTHNRTSHELMVRFHLRLGIPIEELALNPEDREKHRTTEQDSSFDFLKWTRENLNQLSKNAPQQHQCDVVVLKSYCLSNGKLLETGEIPYASRIFNSWTLDKENSIEIETNEGRFIVDKSQNDAVSGSYLIEISGRMSINHIQRLPNKLAVVFGDSTVEVSDDDIKVIGRVAVTLRKD